MGVDLDSDDDRPVEEMTESDIEMFRRIFPGRRDPIVHEFSDLTLSDQAFAEGRDDELLEAPEAGPSMVIEEGRVFKDLPALKRWLQAFAVIRKRPYKVLHSYAERRYTVVCDKERCPWRVCARKQNITGQWKITKVVGPHNCADHELTVRHPQLTSTLIAKRLMGILKEQPNMKVRTIIRTVEEIYGGYVITYGKAWRAKQRAWRMIYGDWESGYEQLPVLFNAIKAVNPGMHYELVAWFNERHAKAEALLVAGERWAEKPKRHLIIANERASTHEVQCFDLGSGTYQVEHRGGTTSDGEIRESRIHVVVLRDFKCTCGRPRQYHFVCSHLVAAVRHRNFDIESMIPHEFSVDTLVRTWSPRFVPFRDPREWPPYDGPKYVADLAYRWNKRGTRKRTRHNMTMDQVSGRTRRGRATPFLADPEQNECGKCGCDSTSLT
ncbi:uncharacterized protein LOC111256652 [Setaria italica]|uniref:uncharacterized protein LOC111256652 n=1 Tax=Setaria italica TaxID=4555 RepID=UPI000BE59CAD|nr:uncharacterized protein LOC111256652 [Setaria italica]